MNYPPPKIVPVGDRVLTVEDVGAAEGFPVLVHSGGGSRHIAPQAIRDAAPFGLRLIGYDRPAYGGSTPLPGRSVADCAADVAAIVAELGLDRLAVWGFSGGGPYALATAALLPDVVAGVCLFAPLGPYGVPGFDFLAGMAEGYRQEVEIFFADRAAAREQFRRDGAQMYGRLSKPDAWLRMWGERAEQDEAHNRESAEYLASLYRDGWTNADDGWWDDWSAFLHPWGFDMAAARAPVTLWHGMRDTRCPPAHSHWLIEQLPHVQAQFPADEDHTNVEDNNRPTAYAWLSAIASAVRGR